MWAGLKETNKWRYSAPGLEMTEATCRSEEAREGSCVQNTRKDLCGEGGLTGGWGGHLNLILLLQFPAAASPLAEPNRKPQGKGAHWRSPYRTAFPSPCPHEAE